MNLQSFGKWLLMLVFMATCGWPKGLPETALPGHASNGTSYPDLLTTPGPKERALRDAAVIVSIEDYTSMDEHLGAHAMAAAWYETLAD